jgi:hypothetical protein
MATIAVDRQCDVCNGQHTFCEPTSDSLTIGKKYEYVCPETGMMGKLTSAADGWKVAEECPPGAVIVWPAGSSTVP